MYKEIIDELEENTSQKKFKIPCLMCGSTNTRETNDKIKIRDFECLDCGYKFNDY